MDNGRPAGHGVVGKAFYKSIPVMAGYIVLGIGFGILLRSAGYGVLWAFAMSAFIYAGSMQYVGVGLLTGGASLLTAALTAFMVNAMLNGWWLLDRLVIVVALGGAFIRLGNLFNSEIYGVETSLPWGFIFERNGETLPKHPTQLYESLSYFIIFAACYITYLRKNGQLHNGRLFGWWMIALWGVRFLIEFVKEEQVDFEKSMSLDMGQWLSVPMIVAGIVIVVLSHKGILKEGIYTTTEKHNNTKK